jgi:hypothetical protein
VPHRGAALSGVVFGDHHVDGIASKPEQHECDRRNRKHHRDRLHQPMNDEGDHARLRFRPFRAKRI